MVKKWLYSILVAFTILFVASVIVSNTKITFDKDSNYAVELPDDMRVAIVSNGDKGDKYKQFNVERVALPQVGDNDVLVLVKSASFTHNDFHYLSNNKDKSSFVPCTDFAGVVAKVGKNVKLYENGDKVFGIVDINKSNGACADYVVVPQNNIYTMPYSLSFKQAASIPTPALLNWFAVHNLERVGLKKGRVLLDDAISEDGIMLTGLLVKNGFEVVAVDDDSVENWVSAYGVKEFIPNSKFADEVEKLKNSFDIVINLKNGQQASSLISTLKPKGTFISFEKTDVKRSDVRILVIDNTLIEKEVFAKMARLVHLAQIQVNVAKEFKLEQIRDAYLLAEKGNLNGKVVLNIN